MMPFEVVGETVLMGGLMAAGDGGIRELVLDFVGPVQILSVVRNLLVVVLVVGVIAACVYVGKKVFGPFRGRN